MSLIASGLALTGATLFDERILRAINSLAGRFALLDRVMEALDEGRPFFTFLLAAAVFALGQAKDTRERQLLFHRFVVALVALITGCIAGRLIAAAMPVRQRPLVALEGLRHLQGQSAVEWRRELLSGRPETSFPSSHAILGTSVGATILWFDRRAGWWLIGLGAALMIPPILFTAVHWPTDVAAGVLVATATGWLAHRCRSWLEQPAAKLHAIAERHPVPSGGAAIVLGVLLVWRAGPHTGLLSAVTRLFQQTLHAG